MPHTATLSPAPSHAAAVSPADAPPPRLADGVELIGEYQGSGFEDPPYLARRSDGQVVQMKRLLFLVAEEIDGSRRVDEIADVATALYGFKLRPDQVHVLVERLRVLGVVAGENGEIRELEKRDPLLALKLRVAVVPARGVEAISRLFAPLFLPTIVVVMLSGLVALDVWLFGFHGIAQAVRGTLYQPALLLLTLALVVVSTAFHECGHAAACHYGGAKPGKIGMGIFIVWPAFYTDVTDAYRLSRAGRLRTDLGGVYFNAIFALFVGGAYFATGYEPLLLLIPIQHAEILHQLLPFIRLDGYYVISDLAGVPDMASRIKPSLASMLPWKRAQASVRELKPWVRAVVRVYVLTLAPVIVLFLALLVLNMPRMLATAWDSGRLEVQTIGHAFGSGDWVTVTATAFQFALLIIVPAGTIITLTQLARRITTGVWRATDGRPPARAAVIACAAGAAAFTAFSLSPPSVYRAIQPGERGTLTGALRQLGEIPSGRPALTQARERELNGAPFRSRAQNGDTSRRRPVGRQDAGQRPAQDGTPAQPSPTTPSGTRTDGTAPGAQLPVSTSMLPNAPLPGANPPDTKLPAATLPGVSVPARTLPATVPSATVSTPAATVPTPAITSTVPSATATTPTLPVPVPTVPTLPTTVPAPTVPTLPPVPPLPGP